MEAGGTGNVRCCMIYDSFHYVVAGYQEKTGSLEPIQNKIRFRFTANDIPSIEITHYKRGS
jgi:hypothetical protein